MILGLLIVVLFFVGWYRHLSINLAPSMTQTWRTHGREWAQMGEQERSEWCHACADWWSLPWWHAMLTRPPKKPPAVRD